MYVFKKRGGRKNKYGMINTNFDTRTGLSHIVHNGLDMVRCITKKNTNIKNFKNENR